MRSRTVWRQKHKPIDTDPSLPVFMNCHFQNRIGNARKEANQPKEQEPPGRMEIRQAALFLPQGPESTYLAVISCRISIRRVL
jgi:hypothetical protein